MAAFSTFAAAETRAYAKVLDKTWANAFAIRQQDGTLAVRVQRLMGSASAGSQDDGEWVEITDDGTV